MKIQLPEKVQSIIAQLMRHGYEAYAVGGCVRDSLLGRVPEDWDITTSATPEEVKAVFKRTVDTGIEHGTVTVMLDKEGFEVTTYRIDGEYEDSRHPKEVLFTRNLVEDLKRRDFTINAMAYNEEAGLVDVFGGVQDLQEKRIRCVGNAGERFDEDALRILRAIRFSAQLDFSIEEATLQAAGERAENLCRISAERIRTEFNKLLLSDHAKRLVVAKEQGITKVFLPEFDLMLGTTQNNPHHIYTVGEHSLCVTELVSDKEKQRKWLFGLGQGLVDKGGSAELLEAAQNGAYTILLENVEWSKKEKQILRLAAFFHDVEKPICKVEGRDGFDHFQGHPEKGAKRAKKILQRLKYDNETIDTATHLIVWHDYRYELTGKAMRRIIHKVGAEYMPLLFELQLSDILSQNPVMLAPKLERLVAAKQMYLDIVAKQECTSLKMLAVNGTDLIAEGYSAGKELGAMLQTLLEYVLEYPEQNTKEALLAYAKQNFRVE